MIETLRKLKEGRCVDIPVYDFATHSRAKYSVSLSLSLNIFYVIHSVLYMVLMSLSLRGL